MHRMLPDEAMEDISMLGMAIRDVTTATEPFVLGEVAASLAKLQAPGASSMLCPIVHVACCNLGCVALCRVHRAHSVRVTCCDLGCVILRSGLCCFCGFRWLGRTPMGC